MPPVGSLCCMSTFELCFYLFCYILLAVCKFEDIPIAATFDEEKVCKVQIVF